MILPFDRMGEYEFALSNIQVILQRPHYRVLNIAKRVCNGFLYLTRGTCTYTYDGGSFQVTPGTLVYLPLCSRHVLQITSEEIEFFRVNFTLTVAGENALFSTHPVKLTDSLPPSCEEAIRALEEQCRLGNSTVEKTALLCTLFSGLHKASPAAARLAPALRHLQQNLSQPLACQELAAMCFLSTARFYELFHDCTGMTPLQYRSKLLLDRAETLLRFGGVSISEISQMLGFSDPSYFSRFFKKHTGGPPTRYPGDGTR